VLKLLAFVLPLRLGSFAVAATRGAAVIALGVSISSDELAIGFSIGLAGLPLPGLITAIGASAGRGRCG
jgi:hypothetical protein